MVVSDLSNNEVEYSKSPSSVRFFKPKICNCNENLRLRISTLFVSGNFLLIVKIFFAAVAKKRRDHIFQRNPAGKFEAHFETLLASYV